MKLGLALLIVATITATGCSHLPGGSATLRDDKEDSAARSIEVHRASFERDNYPGLSEYAKHGYDWYWNRTITEASGFYTKTERRRILEAGGPDVLKSWDDGWNAANAIRQQAYRDIKCAPTNGSSLHSTRGTPPAYARAAPRVPCSSAMTFA
jgi:hypothetical protein